MLKAIKETGVAAIKTARIAILKKKSRDLYRQYARKINYYSCGIQ